MFRLRLSMVRLVTRIRRRSAVPPGRVPWPRRLAKLFGAPLVVLGKRPELKRNRAVGHGLGVAEQGLCGLEILLAAS